MISDNGISRVWQNGDHVLKCQPKTLTDNEIWCLETMYKYGGVPFAEQIDVDLIKIAYIPEEPISDVDNVLMQCRIFLNSLERAGIRHGDLTRPNMIFNNNNLYVLDWAESRLSCDPREDKRPEGDEWWMRETIRKAFQRAL